jgi:hypothetical protein
MKKIIIILLLLPCILNAQLTTKMQVGMADNPVQFIISPSLDYEFYSFHVNGQMIVETSREAPVDFGMKISYQYNFIETGIGYYYRYYTADPIDKSDCPECKENTFAPLLFVSAHYDKWFVEYDRIQEANMFTVGIKYQLNYKQNKK